MKTPETSSSRVMLQEFWHLLYDATSCRDAKTRDTRLLRAWGVVRYIHSGPMDCEHCHTQVRLAIPIISKRFSGETRQYGCLCTNCMFKELDVSRTVRIEVGNARVEYHNEDTVSL
jgi:hypothetical protein